VVPLRWTWTARTRTWHASIGARAAWCVEGKRGDRISHSSE
jgi:hypothetical protein